MRQHLKQLIFGGIQMKEVQMEVGGMEEEEEVGGEEEADL